MFCLQHQAGKIQGRHHHGYLKREEMVLSNSLYTEGYVTDWEKFLDRRKANIGFITRGKAFRHPTDSEMRSALLTEINSWQESKGKINYKISAPYYIAKGHGVNLLADREFEQPIQGPRRESAVQAYIETPMDKDGVLAALGINTEVYKWKEIGILKAFFYWITGKKVRRKND